MRFDKIELVKGDITKLEVDAIVNAANSALRGGGGVDGAIHRAAGYRLVEECARIRIKQGGIPPGEAVITGAGDMKCKFIIHAVGPVWVNGYNFEREILSNAYRNCLNLAVKNAVKTIAFPNISTCTYGFPKEEAAMVAVKEIRSFLRTNKTVKKIIFCSMETDNYNIYKELLSAPEKIDEIENEEEEKQKFLVELGSIR
jgi:O-acetyl-ADP-ribose deacetylase